jgi:hypothetical protein
MLLLKDLSILTQVLKKIRSVLWKLGNWVLLFKINKNTKFQGEEGYAVKPVYNDHHPWDSKFWWFLSGSCSELAYIVQIVNGPSKFWSLWSGGCYSEVVIRLGLTVPRGFMWSFL